MNKVTNRSSKTNSVNITKTGSSSAFASENWTCWRIVRACVPYFMRYKHGRQCAFRPSGGPSWTRVARSWCSSEKYLHFSWIINDHFHTEIHIKLKYISNWYITIYSYANVKRYSGGFGNSTLLASKWHKPGVSSIIS